MMNKKSQFKDEILALKYESTSKRTELMKRKRFEHGLEDFSEARRREVLVWGFSKTKNKESSIDAEDSSFVQFWHENRGKTEQSIFCFLSTSRYKVVQI